VSHNIKKYKYNTILHNFILNLVYLVNVDPEIKKVLNPEIIKTLTFSFKYISMPTQYHKNLIIRITVYSQHSKQIIKQFVNELKQITTLPKHNT
jgi:hypothetical protein